MGIMATIYRISAWEKAMSCAYGTTTENMQEYYITRVVKYGTNTIGKIHARKPVAAYLR